MVVRRRPADRWQRPFAARWIGYSRATTCEPGCGWSTSARASPFPGRNHPSTFSIWATATASDRGYRNSGVMTMQRTGAQIIWESLVAEGVNTVFGYPGGAILPAYDAMLDYPVRHVLVRHEQSAVHMADGYARACGQVGVAIATSGPGATTLVMGIATAKLDSSPIVCITGQVPSHVLGTDAFQEIDIVGITMPITKHNYLVKRAEDIAPTMREAFAIARSGRPGPVLVDITKDAQQATTELTNGVVRTSRADARP